MKSTAEIKNHRTHGLTGRKIESKDQKMTDSTETLSAGLAVDILRLDGASVLVRR